MSAPQVIGFCPQERILRIFGLVLPGDWPVAALIAVYFPYRCLTGRKLGENPEARYRPRRSGSRWLISLALRLDMFLASKDETFAMKVLIPRAQGRVGASLVWNRSGAAVFNLTTDDGGAKGGYPLMQVAGLIAAKRWLVLEVGMADGRILN